MFQNISKIVIKPKKCKKAESIIVVSQRMQCSVKIANLRS